MLEEKKKEAVKKLNDEATTRKMNQLRTGVRTRIDMPFEKPLFNDNFIEEMKVIDLKIWFVFMFLNSQSGCYPVKEFFF